jgi:hypothetical protein
VSDGLSPEAKEIYDELWRRFSERIASDEGRAIMKETMKASREAGPGLKDVPGVSAADAQIMGNVTAWTTVAVRFALESMAEYLAEQKSTD